MKLSENLIIFICFLTIFRAELITDDTQARILQLMRQRQSLTQHFSKRHGHTEYVDLNREKPRVLIVISEGNFRKIRNRIKHNLGIFKRNQSFEYLPISVRVPQLRNQQEHQRRAKMAMRYADRFNKFYM